MVQILFRYSHLREKISALNIGYIVIFLKCIQTILPYPVDIIAIDLPIVRKGVEIDKKL